MYSLTLTNNKRKTDHENSILQSRRIVFLPSSRGYLYIYIYIYIYMFGSFENLYFYLNRHHTAEQKQRGRQSCTCTLTCTCTWHLRICEWCHLQSFFINFFVLFFVLISQHLTTVARWWRQEKNNNICWPRNTSNSAKSGRAGHRNLAPWYKGETNAGPRLYQSCPSQL